MPQFPLTVPALRVVQPMGVFYVVVLPADVLLEVCYSDKLSARRVAGHETYELEGTQRPTQAKRLEQIADYIDRTDAAFPNAIILAANFREEDGLVEEDPEPDAVAPASGLLARRWFIEESEDGCHHLTVPTASKLAAIIDGQHRLLAFANVSNGERLKMNLICSVFIDLAKPFQAQLFATINSTQKAVDKSLTYELFGYNIEEEDEEYWSPDKLAVFMTRKLATDTESPLRSRIIIAPQKDEALTEISAAGSWKVSTAVVVEGILRLISSNPKKDTTNLLDGSRKKRLAIASLRKDTSPLRDLYINGRDKVIYAMIQNYLAACEQVFWTKAVPESFITRTVGVQALFDVLRAVAKVAYEDKDLRVERFVRHLSPAGRIDFASDAFRNASGSGRSTIRRALDAAIAAG